MISRSQLKKRRLEIRYSSLTDQGIIQIKRRSLEVLQRIQDVQEEVQRNKIHFEPISTDLSAHDDETSFSKSASFKKVKSTFNWS
jgi:hypothetical protein